MVREDEAPVGIELPLQDDSSLDNPSLDEYDTEPSQHEPHELRIIVNATDPVAIRPTLAALETAYWRHRAQSAPLALESTPAEVTWLYNPEGRTDWMIVPGLIGVVAMISTLLLGALTLVRERERGSWETLLTTPVDAIDALIGKLSPYLIIGVGQAALVLYIARLLFDLPLTGDLWALLLVVPLYAAAHLILGFAFSALAES